MISREEVDESSGSFTELTDNILSNVRSTYKLEETDSFGPTIQDNSSCCNLFIDEESNSELPGPSSTMTNSQGNSLGNVCEIESSEHDDEYNLRLKKREALRKRLKLLIELSKQHPLDADDCVAGDKSIKYQLKYRTI